MESKTQIIKQFCIRFISKLALLEEIKNFWADLLENFESICEAIVEKFDDKDPKKSHFSNQSDF